MALSFQYCCLCLEKFYKNPIYRDYHHVYFFVPKHDFKHQSHIILVKMHVHILQKLHQKNLNNPNHTLINLRHIASIIHVEKGFIDNQMRLQIIIQYYKKRSLLTTIQQEFIA